MGGHRRYDRSPHQNPNGNGVLDQTVIDNSGKPYILPRFSRPISWIMVLVGLMAWSLLAWLGYALADPMLGWVTANGGFVLESGKGLAAGAGKEAASVAQSIKTSGALGQTLAFLSAVLKPAIIILWAVGALAILAAPLILPRLGGLLGRRRH